MFKKFFFILFISVFLLSGCANNKEDKNIDVYHSIIERDKLIVGVQFEAKPFGYLDKNNELKGVDIDIAKELARRILGSSDKLELKKVTPANRIQAVTSGEVDIVVATMSITPQRKLIVNFSNPYYIAGQAILVPNDSKIRTINDLRNRPIGVVLGTTGEKNLRYFAPQAILRGYKNYTNAFTALKNKQVDAMSTDDAILLGFIMDDKNFKILPKRLTKEPYGIAMKNTEDAKSLELNINRFLNDMRDDGFMYNLYKKWNIRN